MLPSVLPTESDHVPVLADEVVATLDPRPGETVVDATFGAGGHAALLAARLRGDGKLIAIDRDPTVAPYFERVPPRDRACKARLLHGEFSTVARAARRQRRARPTSILLDLGVSSMQLDRPERGFSYAVDAPLDMRMDPSAELLGARARQRGRRARARRHLQALRRGALRRARSRARSSGGAASSRSSARASSSRRSRPRSPRRRASARGIRPSASSRRCASRSTTSSARSSARCRPRSRCCAPAAGSRVISFHSLEDRIVKRFLRAQEHGCTCPPDFPVCVCGSRADAARDAAARDPPVGGRGRAQPARAVGAPARGDEGWLAGSHAGRRPSPSRSPRRAPAARTQAREGAAGARPRRHPLDRGQRDSARGRRIRERGGAPAEPRARLGELASATKLRAENAALAVAALERARVVADPGAGREAARPRLRRSRPIRLRRTSRSSEATDKQANRRIRLLLAVFVLVFAATLARAVWLQGVHAAALGQHGRAPAPRDDHDPCRARDDLRPHGRPARDRRADDDGLRRPAPGRRSRARSPSPRTSCSASTRTRSTRSCSNKHDELRLRRSASPTRRRRRRS